MPHVVVGAALRRLRARERCARAGASARARGAARPARSRLLFADPRSRCRARRRLRSSLGGWAWGSVRLAELDRSVLVSRIGTVEHARRRGRRAAEGRQLRPARASRPPPLGDAPAARAGLPRAAARPRRRRREPTSRCSRSFARRPARRTASTRRRGCDGRESTSSCARRAVARRRPARRDLRRSATTSSGGSRATALRGLRGERRNVVEAIVLGRSNLVGQSLLADFRASGLYHCLAVDGLKVATIAAARSSAIALLVGLGRLARRGRSARRGRRVRARGRPPSVRRARRRSRQRSARSRGSPRASATAGRRCSSARPFSSRGTRTRCSTPGFQLSFAAVASIFVVTPRVVRALEGYPVSRSLAQLIGVSTACGLATAPVTWLQFHQISLVTVPANVVAVPVVVEVLGLALVTAAIAPVRAAGRLRARVAQRLGRVVRRRVRARASGACPARRSRRAAGPPSSAWARSGQPPMLGGVANERALKPVYLFTGSDRPKIALALQRLRARDR